MLGRTTIRWGQVSTVVHRMLDLEYPKRGADSAFWANGGSGSVRVMRSESGEDARARSQWTPRIPMGSQDGAAVQSP